MIRLNEILNTATCTQCDRTMPAILEFTHECTYTFTEDA